MYQIASKALSYVDEQVCIIVMWYCSDRWLHTPHVLSNSWL